MVWNGDGCMSGAHRAGVLLPELGHGLGGDEVGGGGRDEAQHLVPGQGGQLLGRARREHLAWPRSCSPSTMALVRVSPVRKSSSTVTPTPSGVT